MRWPIDRREAEDPHAKASLLLQAHLGRTMLPISDYVTDTRTVLDNTLRILQVKHVKMNCGVHSDLFNNYYYLILLRTPHSEFARLL